ncbi:MAG: hypothetical protein KC983_12580, partial [Phycisphaerales bacterium]|nr:hypothetical protein [Phycisphaerales bacterium]
TSGEGDPNDLTLPGVYVIPMKGQMGTDINENVYNDELIELIREADPALIIWELECADRDDLMLTQSTQEEQSLMDLEQYRRMVANLQDELRDIPQVMWVRDSWGISSVFALAWPDMYMSSKARLLGMRQIYEAGTGWTDSDVRAKMVAAWVGIGNGFLERGGYPIELGRAMMNPTYVLSATWKGRDVRWTLDDKGEYLFDSSDERTAMFNAKTAEDFRISDGTADTLDDLMLLLGYREYRVVDGEADDVIAKYIEDWRRAYEKCKTLVEDYRQHMGWAQGDETVKWLGASRKDLEQILSAMKRYSAVEIRMQREFGMSQLQLELEIDKIKERIRNRGRGGGGGSSFGGGGGGGRGRG